MGIKTKNRLISAVLGVMNSDMYPFVNAAVFTLLYYLSLDIVALYYLALSIIFAMLFCDDLTPFFSQVIFVNFVVSYNNSPSSVSGGSGYYLNPVIYVQIFALIFLCASAVIYRLALAISQKRFNLNGVSVSLIIFACSLLLSGAFSDDYSGIDFFYGFALAFFFCIINFVFNGNAKTDGVNVKKICLAFVALSAMLLVQLSIKIVTNFGAIIQDGVIQKSGFTFGWGIWNTMSMYLVISIPPIFCLACREDKGYLYFIYAIAVFVAVFVVSSRQGMLGAVLIFPICLFMLLKYGKNRTVNIAITLVFAGLVLIFVGCFFDSVKKMFSGVLSQLFNSDGNLSGSFRVELFGVAIENFITSPIFGVGFEAPTKYAIEFVGLNGIIPLMYHNTVAQLLASCGVVGIAAYCHHRFQTIKSLIKNRSLERAFLALSVAALLLLNLFDNHLFYFFPTMIYSSLIHYITGKEIILE